MRRGSVAIATAALVVLAASGCAGTPPPSSAPPPSATLPPRPATLNLDNVDPCSLLTAQQQKKFGVNAGVLSNQDYGGPLQGPSCLWSNLPNSPDNDYTGGLVTNHGAEFALGREPPRSVGGYAATSTTSTGSDPNYYCQILVDVAEGKALAADYGNGAKDYPGMNREIACANAQKLAEALLATLRSQQVR